jgi:hypothetical protein
MQSCHMHSEYAFCFEGLGTSVACKTVRRCVRGLMSFQIGKFIEQMTANRTPIWKITGVKTAMINEGSGRFENFVAFLTSRPSVLIIMHVTVPVQRTQMRKPTQTDTALVWLFMGVSAHMNGQPMTTRKFPPT